jgi:type IV pilus assembly protein PilA
MSIAMQAKLQELSTKKKNNEAGFSLVELLVVVLIIGILSAIAIPIFLNQQNQAREAALKSDLANAKLAMVSYGTDNGGDYSPATTLAALQTSLSSSYGLKASDKVTLTLKSAATSTFCFEADHSALTNDTWKVTESTAPAKGTC